MQSGYRCKNKNQIIRGRLFGYLSKEFKRIVKTIYIAAKFTVFHVNSHFFTLFHVISRVFTKKIHTFSSEFTNFHTFHEIFFFTGMDGKQS
jgi:hypothetical protein